jgi:hypothetical protein
MVHKPAVAVVFHHIGPYHHARLNAAADRLSMTGIEWSATGYDTWGAADSPARYPKKILSFRKQQKTTRKSPNCGEHFTQRWNRQTLM